MVGRGPPARRRCRHVLGQDRRHTLNTLLFPGPTREFNESRQKYSDLGLLPTTNYLYGLPGFAVAVAVVLHDDDVYAIHDECSHAAIPLSEGEVDGCEIECWLHGSRFDLRTGKPSGPPATEPVPTYPVRVEGGDVLVDVTAPLNDD